MSVTFFAAIDILSEQFQKEFFNAHLFCLDVVFIAVELFCRDSYTCIKLKVKVPCVGKIKLGVPVVKRMQEREDPAYVYTEE